MNNVLAMQLAQFAQRALLYEVTLSPKPGLVDRYSNGAHRDMNFYTFIDSAISLVPFFEQYAAIGLQHQGSLLDLFQKIRTLGIQAEKKMLTATKGINTHKGAHFSFAIILAATGYHFQTAPHDFPLTAHDTQTICQYVAEMTASLIEQDFANLSQKPTLSHGEKLYLTYGIRGIRGEVSQGFPHITKKAMPLLRSLLTTTSQETALLRVLIDFMAHVEDSNLIHRGGISAWKKVQQEAQQLAQVNDDAHFIDALQTYDQTLIERHLSPGGAADLLAICIYFSTLEGII
ncbi:MAG: triphosphoribosyl-dephospho-CoA synthase CitG [Aerococcaceae bacterium]|nr:triphosphoribosyl-dephospho-CoA synthase CitG [Aerococcaceae bacterium]